MFTGYLRSSRLPLRGHPASITDKVQIHCESYRGLTGNYFCYHEPLLLRIDGHFRITKKKIIVLTLDKADTMKISINIIDHFTVNEEKQG